MHAPEPAQRLCITRVKLSTRPDDLKPWAEIAAALALTPHPMSARDIRRKYKAAGWPTWKAPGVRGELVSRSSALQFHRNLWRGWAVIAA